MKKRILSILLTLCMTLCLTPISVFAEEVGTEGSAAIQLGADALSVLSKNVNTATAPTVYFGQNHENNPTAWRVIGYDGSGVTSSQGDITLLAAGAMGVIPFVDTILNNEYAPSNLKATIDALAEKLTTEENAAVKKRTLTSGSYDGENTDCVAGGQVDNAVFWPLSAKEAIAVNNDLRALNPAHPNWVDSGWWLRSPGSDKYRLAVVRSEGSVQYSGFSVLIFNNHRTVRPAFNLNLKSVLFASAAVGGKPDGGLTPIPEYSGNEWKLTLLDSRRNFAVTEKTVSAVPDDTVTLNYKGATRGKNEYISVILADNNGAQYYGRVAQPTAKSGTVEIKIPSDIAPGDYTMKVFSEQYNGDCKTDLASAFADVTLTVESQPDEQFTLAPGGRYYFDLSAMNISGTVNSNLPDSTLHYVPFTYAGTVNAYKLTSEMATTEEYAQKNKYPHSLFIADYAVTHTVSWDDLNTAGLIFGKNYASGGVDYTLRAPSVGSDNRGSGDSERGTPQSNEWDRILDKDSGYIKNWNGIFSWGQDTTRYNSSLRAIRGYDSGRRWNDDDATDFLPLVGFRPVLEVLNPFCIRGEVQAFHIYILISYPADVLIGHIVSYNVNVILIFKTVFEHLKLQNANNADYYPLHAGIRLAEYLNLALLRYLLNALYKLLALKAVLLLYNGEMLGGEGRNTLKSDMLFKRAYRIAYCVNTGVENADYVARIRLVNYLAFLRHHLLRLRQPHGLSRLNVVVIRPAFKFARAYAEKGNSVAVVLIHIRLNFRGERRKIIVKRVNRLAVRHTRQGGCGHFKEVLQKRLNPEIGERRTEENRGQLAAAHLFKVKFIACAVK